jgi:hypothetical protein
MRARCMLTNDCGVNRDTCLVWKCRFVQAVAAAVTRTHIRQCIVLILAWRRPVSAPGHHRHHRTRQRHRLQRRRWTTSSHGCRRCQIAILLKATRDHRKRRQRGRLRVRCRQCRRVANKHRRWRRRKQNRSNQPDAVPRVHVVHRVACVMIAMSSVWFM